MGFDKLCSHFRVQVSEVVHEGEDKQPDACLLQQEPRPESKEMAADCDCLAGFSVSD